MDSDPQPSLLYASLEVMAAQASYRFDKVRLANDQINVFMLSQGFILCDNVMVLEWEYKNILWGKNADGEKENKEGKTLIFLEAGWYEMIDMHYIMYIPVPSSGLLPSIFSFRSKMSYPTAHAYIPAQSPGVNIFPRVNLYKNKKKCQ